MNRSNPRVKVMLMAHSPDGIGLQARNNGNALGSLPSLVKVPLQLPGT
jgi:hypothetical protein